MTACSNV